MIKKNTLLFSLILFFIDCGPKIAPITIQTDEGLSIKITKIKPDKANNRLNGYMEITNTTDGYVLVSNQEIFLFCDQEKSRTFVRMAGEWEIDQKLIGLQGGKTVFFDVYWELPSYSEGKELRGEYIKVLERENSK